MLDVQTSFAIPDTKVEIMPAVRMAESLDIPETVKALIPPGPQTSSWSQQNTLRVHSGPQCQTP